MSASYLALVPESKRRHAVLAHPEAWLEADRRALDASPLRALLQLAPADARSISEAYEDVLSALPSNVALESLADLHAAGSSLPADDQRRLAVLLPAIFYQDPRQQG